MALLARFAGGVHLAFVLFVIEPRPKAKALSNATTGNSEHSQHIFSNHGAGGREVTWYKARSFSAGAPFVKGFHRRRGRS